MTQNEKDLLIKDLCARLSYGIEVEYNSIKCEVLSIDTYNEELTIRVCPGYCPVVKLEDVKPFLFPLSSMTEEQKKEYRKVCELDTEILENHPMDGSPFPAMYNSQDWLDAHHFDYRGLIPMGLALDATGLNIY